MVLRFSMRHLSLKVDDALAQRIEAEAETSGRRLSDVLRSAIRAGLSQSSRETNDRMLISRSSMKTR